MESLIHTINGAKKHTWRNQLKTHGLKSKGGKTGSTEEGNTSVKLIIKRELYF